MNIALLGTKFMGRAHSNAWRQAACFFDLPRRPALRVACGRDREHLADFAATWGWADIDTDWQRVVERDDVDVIDICLPPHLHREVAEAAAACGKHLFCEKPLAPSLADAEAMRAAAEEAGVVHYLNHNYRRAPAVRLARQLIDEGRVGRVYHWRGAYQQDWLVDPATPHSWKLSRAAGGGAHSDLNSHSVDLARYLVGEIADVSGRMATFVETRPDADGVMRDVDVEDAALMHVRFENGALGSFEATRCAGGCKNRNHFEIYGSRGSLRFDLQRLNELEFCDLTVEDGRQGFQTLLATRRSHPYMSHWWPPGHNIGYEHTFVHAVADFTRAVHDGGGIRPDFGDGVACQAVLEAAAGRCGTRDS